MPRGDPINGRVEIMIQGRFHVMLAAMLLAGGAALRADDPAPPTPREHAVPASNQAVSLDLLENPHREQVKGASASPLPSPESPAHDAGDEMDQELSSNSEKKQSSLLSAGGKEIRRRPQRLTERPQQDQATPWYRTGLGALAIVLVIMAGGYWVVRRWVPSTRSAGSNALRVVARTSVTSKHHLALIQLGRRFVLVSVSGDRMSRVCEVTEAQEVAEVAAQTGAVLQGRLNEFDNLLAQEAADYLEDHDAGEVEERTRASRTRSQRPVRPQTHRPVADLLARLRALQSK